MNWATKYYIFFSALTIYLFGYLSNVNAQQLTITGNGDSSSSQVNISQQATQNVQQSNHGVVSNSLTTQAITGSNHNSNNQGNTSISTGNINTDTNINNQLNHSTVSTDCCENNSTNSATINGNGRDSYNSIKIDSKNQTNINVDQNASITSSNQQYLNTGANLSKENAGGVKIDTGDIHINENLKNHHVNQTEVEIGQELPGGFKLSIKDNGKGSSNIIEIQSDSSTTVEISNKADIENENHLTANTGKNESKSNLDDVIIVTGNITIDKVVENGPINTTLVDIDCCPEEDKPDNGESGPHQQPPVSSAPNPPHVGGGSNPPGSVGPTSSGGGGMVLAAMTNLGAVLPASGNYFTMLMTILSGLMFFLGMYLRHHPGRDPGLVYI